MRNSLLIIVLFAFGSFGFAQVVHNINNMTDAGGLCPGHNLFASFDNSSSCPTATWQTCFDVPLGITNHDAQNENCNTFMDVNDIKGITLEAQGGMGSGYVSFCDSSGNLLLNGTAFISGIPYCNQSGPTTVIWSIDTINHVVNVTII